MHQCMPKLDGPTCVVHPPDGWCKGPWADMSCVRVMGLVLKAKKENRDHTVQESTMCVAITQNQASISARLRSQFRSVAGSHVQHAKNAWDEIVRVAKSFEQMTSTVGLSKLAEIEGLVDALAAANVEGDQTAIYNALIDI
eukprot:8504698-Pyramimonas_sp.AAC.1